MENTDHRIVTYLQGILWALKRFILIMKKKDRYDTASGERSGIKNLNTSPKKKECMQL